MGVSPKLKWIRLLTTFAGLRGLIALGWCVWLLSPHALDNPSYEYFRQLGRLPWLGLALVIGCLQLWAVLSERPDLLRWGAAVTAVMFMTVAIYIWLSPVVSMLVPTSGLLGLGSLAALVTKDVP